MVRLKSEPVLGFSAICLLAATILGASARGAQRRNECVGQQAVTKVVYLEPFYVNIFLQQNTTFNINKNIAVTITDAPTSLDIVLTGSATRFITGSHSTYSTAMYFMSPLPPPLELTLDQSLFSSVLICYQLLLRLELQRSNPSSSSF